MINTQSQLMTNQGIQETIPAKMVDDRPDDTGHYEKN